MGELESQILCIFCASVMNHDALAQPQSHRGYILCLNSPA